MRRAGAARRPAACSRCDLGRAAARRLARHPSPPHMLAHMGVVAIAAPLIAIGLAGTRWLARRAARRRRCRCSPRCSNSSPSGAGMRRPCAPLAEASPAATVVEQASFLAAGLLLWLASFAAPGERSTRRRRRRAAADLDPHDAARRAAGAQPAPALRPRRRHLLRPRRSAPARTSSSAASSCCWSARSSISPAASFSLARMLDGAPDAEVVR